MGNREVAGGPREAWRGASLSDYESPVNLEVGGVLSLPPWVRFWLSPLAERRLAALSWLWPDASLGERGGSQGPSRGCKTKPPFPAVLPRGRRPSFSAPFTSLVGIHLARSWEEREAGAGKSGEGSQANNLEN